MLDALLFTKTPKLLTAVYPDCLWKVDTKDKTIYLTFDDGPIAEITPFVLDELKNWNAKATFFCIGKNIETNPEIFKRIIDEGHSVGNHTYDHLNGWNTTDEIYFDNVEKGGRVMSHTGQQTLFRPPYGKLKPAQYAALKAKYKLVMWDVMSYDIDLSMEKEKVLKNVIENTEDGSIIVMHDSLKAKPKVEFALPKLLEHFTAKGFKFEKL